MIYSEFTVWSPIVGAEVTRLSMVDERNEEYFMLLTGMGERGFGDKRRKAIEMLTKAIEAETGPGEYRWR